MAEIFCGVVSEGETTRQCKPSSRAARRRRMEIRRVKFVDMASSAAENGRKRRKLQVYASSFNVDSQNSEDNSASDEDGKSLLVENRRSETKRMIVKSHSSPSLLIPEIGSQSYPKFGVASVCGRRRDMEDTVAIHPSFNRQVQDSDTTGFHYFGVYDGHGCSHVRVLNFPFV